MSNAKVTVTSNYSERCQPYRVRMTCGHVETRMMRPATAGIAWSPEAEIAAPYAACKACEAAKQAAREAAWAKRAEVDTCEHDFDLVSGKCARCEAPAPVEA
jgi:hypothetical protein